MKKNDEENIEEPSIENTDIKESIQDNNKLTTERISDKPSNKETIKEKEDDNKQDTEYKKEKKKVDWIIMTIDHSTQKERKNAINQILTLKNKSLRKILDEKLIEIIKDEIELEATISEIVEDNCDGCAYCIDPCPYKALTLIEYMLKGDVKKTVEQITKLYSAGSELVRITVNNEKAARAVPAIIKELIKQKITVPIIGDFHYNGHLLLTKYPECAQALAKYRINPGNVGIKARDKMSPSIPQ